MQQLAHTFRLLDTGHFDHNLADLTFTAKDLDVRLRNTEAVDTRTNDFV